MLKIDIADVIALEAEGIAYLTNNNTLHKNESDPDFPYYYNQQGLRIYHFPTLLSMLDYFEDFTPQCMIETYNGKHGEGGNEEYVITYYPIKINGQFRNLLRLDFEIDSAATIRTIIYYLRKYEHVDFNPDTPFSEYINSHTKKPTFNKTRAKKLDKLVGYMIEWCEQNNADIHKICCATDAIFYPDILTYLPSVNCYINTETGDTFKVVDGKIDLEDPLHVQDIEIDDWFEGLNPMDTAIVNKFR